MMKFKIYDAKKVVPKHSGWYLCIMENYATTLNYDAAQRGWNIFSTDRTNELFPVAWVDCSMAADELRKRMKGE